MNVLLLVVLVVLAVACEASAATPESAVDAQIADPPTTEVVPHPAEVTVDSTATIPPAPTEPGVDLYCGEFGSEQLPELYAIDIVTGDLRWSVCPVRLTMAAFIGRAAGVTLVHEFDGAGHNQIVAFDDRGRELWRHDSGSIPRFVLAESTLVPFGEPGEASIEAIDTSSGAVRWHHPGDEGMPVAAGQGVMIEVIGEPYTQRLANPFQPELAVVVVRALDEASGPIPVVDRGRDRSGGSDGRSGADCRQ